MWGWGSGIREGNMAPPPPNYFILWIDADVCLTFSCFILRLLLPDLAYFFRFNQFFCMPYWVTRAYAPTPTPNNENDVFLRTLRDCMYFNRFVLRGLTYCVSIVLWKRHGNKYIPAFTFSIDISFLCANDYKLWILLSKFQATLTFAVS